MTLAVVERHRQVDVGEVTLHWTEAGADRSARCYPPLEPTALRAPD